MLNPLESMIRGLLKECPEIKAPRVTETLRDDYGYTGSVDLVRKRMAVLRPASGLACCAADGLSAWRYCRSTGRRCRLVRGSGVGSGGSTR